MAQAEVPLVKVHYGKPMLPDVSRVLACLYEKDVEFKLVHLPDFLKLQLSHESPKAPITVFEDGCTLLFDSRAICRYIAEKHVDRGNKYLLGRDLLERSSIEQWLKLEEQSFYPPSWELIFHLAFPPEANLSIDRALQTQSEKKLATVLDVYEHRLSESRFLAGNEFTLADLSHLPGSDILANSEEYSYLFDSRKNVKRWFKKISKRPSWKKVIDSWAEVIDSEAAGAEDSKKIKTTLQLSPSKSSGPQSSKVYYVTPPSETEFSITSTQPTPAVEIKSDRAGSESSKSLKDSLQTGSTNPSTISKLTSPDSTPKTTTTQPLQTVPSTQSTTQTSADSTVPSLTTKKSTTETNQSSRPSQTVSTTQSASQPQLSTQVQNDISNPKPQQDPSDISPTFTPKRIFQPQNNLEKTDNRKAKSEATSSITDSSLGEGTGSPTSDQDKNATSSSQSGSHQGNQFSGETTLDGDQQTLKLAAATKTTKTGDSAISSGEEATKINGKSKTEQGSSVLGSQQSNTPRGLETSNRDQQTPKPAAAKQPTVEGDLAAPSGETASKNGKSKTETAAASQSTGTSDSAASSGEAASKSSAKSKTESESTKLGSQQSTTDSAKEDPKAAEASQTAGTVSAASTGEAVPKSSVKEKTKAESTPLGSQQSNSFSGDVASVSVKKDPKSAAASQTAGTVSAASTGEAVPKSSVKEKTKAESTPPGSQQSNSFSGDMASGSAKKDPKSAAASQSTGIADSVASTGEAAPISSTSSLGSNTKNPASGTDTVSEPKDE